ncbi:unnamed protein product [Rodentolepis nana]|uniref:G_PROTEIN_RECEP_F2_4 domain-containing protein n=1 Tax=Rodentolepis nana TaxID=102285 RepID=A0A0R3TP63_RODNA|nr:unnamed protein product [Rodentolepis nana]
MLAIVTHFTLLALLTPLSYSETTEQISSTGNTEGGFGSFESPGNVSALTSQKSMVRCIGAKRGILLAAGVHLDPYVEAIGQCPEGADSKLAELCATDFHESESSVEKLQDDLQSALNSGSGLNLRMELYNVIQNVSPVLDATSGVLYANKYCAQCHHAKIRSLPRQLLCSRFDDIMKCFIAAEMPTNPKNCRPDRPEPKFMFQWDSIFNLPDETEYSGSSDEDRVFEILQWICCAFSIIALIFAIIVFTTSPRLRIPLPGKMMIALCFVLLGSVIFFVLASGVMEIIPTPMRPLCVALAWLLLLFLLSSFVWMVMFSLELFRTFGLTRLFRKFFLCFCCRKDGGRKGNATSMMLRARGSDSNTSTRFRRQIIASIIVPLSIGIPALAINESAYIRIKPIYDVSTNEADLEDVAESELGTFLYRVNPNCCPVNKPNYAWFSGHYTALLIWFLVPAGIMICFNILSLIIVCIQIYRLKRETGLSTSSSSPLRDSHKKSSKSLFAICAKLSVILGASWFIQFLAALCPHLFLLQKIAGLMTNSQGGVIAISMLAGTKARRAMARWLPKRWQEALGISESTSRSTQEMTTSARSKSRITGQTDSTQTTSLLRNSSS